MAKTFEGENDRVKYFVLLSGEEDEKIVRATSGALAILTCDSIPICNKVFEVKVYYLKLPFRSQLIIF